eukprot:4090208-Pyramimonas_sp.AAC.1
MSEIDGDDGDDDDDEDSFNDLRPLPSVSQFVQSLIRSAWEVYISGRATRTILMQHVEEHQWSAFDI